MEKKPYVEIVEQPAEKSFRFRYESEGRLGGAILGANSTRELPSYPTIKVGNYTGMVAIRISCVTHNNPAKQHPHKLSSKGEMLDSGHVWTKFFRVEKSEEKSQIIQIKDIGIVFVKKPTIEESLKHRRNEKESDPTKGGWDNISRPHLFDLHQVRLCFQAFSARADAYNPEKTIYGNIGYALSTLVVDKKSNGSLKIIDISTTVGSVYGGDKVMIFCDKVKSQDISVVFYEEDDDRQIIWRKEVNNSNPTEFRVHHQYAIAFFTPAYKELDIKGSRKVFLQLFRRSDKEISEPVEFGYLPNQQSTIQLQRKKTKKVSETTKVKELPCVLPVCKVDKSKYSSNPQVDRKNILIETSTTNSMQRPTNLQSFNNLAGENKENNLLMMPNNQLQNTFQGALIQTQYQQLQTVNTNLFDGQYNIQCGAYTNPNYFYTPSSAHQNINGHFGEPSNAQSTYQRPPLIPTVYQPQPQQQQQQPLQPQSQANHFANGQQHGGYVNLLTDSPANYSMNPAMNCLPLTFNNDTNKTVDYSVNNTQVMNDNPAINNLSDLINTSEVMTYWNDADKYMPNEEIKIMSDDGNEDGIDGISRSLDKIKF